MKKLIAVLILLLSFGVNADSSECIDIGKVARDAMTERQLLVPVGEILKYMPKETPKHVYDILIKAYSVKIEDSKIKKDIAIVEFQSKITIDCLNK